MCLVNDINDLVITEILGSKDNFNFVFENVHSFGFEKYSLIFRYADISLFADALQQIEGRNYKSIYLDIVEGFKSNRDVNYTGILLERHLDRYKPTKVVDDWYSLRFSKYFDLVNDSVFNEPTKKIYYISMDWSTLIDNINNITSYELLGR